MLVMLISQGTGEQEMMSSIKKNTVGGLEYLSSCQPCGYIFPIQLNNKNQRGIQFF